MLQNQLLREKPEFVIERLKVRNFDAEETVNRFLEVDAEMRKTKTEFEQNKAEANSLAKEIGQKFREGKAEEGNRLKARSSELKDITKNLQDKLHQLENDLRSVLYNLPNIPNQLVPAGSDEADNEVVYEEGEITDPESKKTPHWELASKYDIINFEMGAKVTGAGFPFYKGKGAAFQRALINFFLAEATGAGYTEYQAPLLVNEASGIGTGQLPDKEGQMYHITDDNLFLIPTAEVPITNIYRDTILNEGDFPIKSTGYTPCFRREAGSYGKDVKGLNRLHQFDKVEIVQIAHPDNSYDVLEEMLEHSKNLLRKLGLKFRVARLCGGDLGFTSALTYDLEVFSVAQDRWLEVSSVSNFETYQANRLKLRYKGKDGKTHLAHTLNGSALALPRVVAALFEHYQAKDGIEVPEVLQPYTNFKMIN